MTEPGRARDAASHHGHSEEMLESWEVRWLHFNDGVSFELVNAEIARVAAGWEPFATLQHRSGGWALLLKRKIPDA